MAPNNLQVGGVVPNLTVANRVFTDLKNLILVSGQALTTSANSTPRKMGVGSGYTPSGGKSFHVYAIRYSVLSITANSGSYFGYCDNDVGNGSATAPINLVQFPGSGGSASLLSEGVAGTFELSVDFIVPNGKYPYFGSNGSTTRIGYEFFGYEE